MNYKIYIQSINGFPIGDWACSAYLGFKSKQADIYFFEDINEVPISKYVILVSSIENTNVYLESLGLPPKMGLNIPIELMKYADRDIRYMTVGEFKKLNVFPIFVKPNGKAKEFIGGVVEKQSTVDNAFFGVSDDKLAMVSEVVNFVSEYRGYVIDKELKGIKHYSGDFRIFPDMNIIDQAIKDYTSQPAGYSIDFGITDDGRTLLVECNDGWSLGNYGLNDVTYSTLLTKRWLQLTKDI